MSRLKHLVPVRVRRSLRRLWSETRAGRFLAWHLTDLREKGARLLGLGDPLLPPLRLREQVGNADFRATGATILGELVALAGLRPGESVLEVGCGCGRIAVPLTGYLGARGRYEGFDICEPLVRWCRRHVTPRFPNFAFRHADIYNGHYNPRSRTRACEYRFPYPDGEFDLVFLTSVFTHLLPADLEHYLAEIARVLRPGGRCFATAFLLNAESLRLAGEGAGQFRFGPARDGWATLDPADPEAAVAYEEGPFLERFRRHGLSVRRPIDFGDWCGRAGCRAGQDIVVAFKADSPRAPGGAGT
ncbi:MAG TPA: class I SAM-dependent methyltransferase [Gemmataceae bacterium]